jgi:hypothetical protein
MAPGIPSIPPRTAKPGAQDEAKGYGFESSPATDFGVPLPASDDVPMILMDDVYAAIDEDAATLRTNAVVEDQYLAPTASVVPMVTVASEYQYLPAEAAAAPSIPPRREPASAQRLPTMAPQIDHNEIDTTLDEALADALAPMAESTVMSRVRAFTEWQRPQVVANNEEVYGAVQNVGSSLASTSTDVPVLTVSRVDADAMLQPYLRIDGAFLLRQRPDGSVALSMVIAHATAHFVIQSNPGRGYLVNDYLLPDCASTQDVVNHLKTTLELGTRITCLLSFLVTADSAA